MPSDMFPTFFIIDCTPTLDLHRNNARNTEYNVLAIMDHKTICDIYRLDRQKGDFSLDDKI